MLEFYENVQSRCIGEHICLSASVYKIIIICVGLKTFRSSVLVFLTFQPDIRSIIGFSVISKTDGVSVHMR